MWGMLLSFRVSQRGFDSLNSHRPHLPLSLSTFTDTFSRLQWLLHQDRTSFQREMNTYHTIEGFLLDGDSIRSKSKLSGEKRQSQLPFWRSNRTRHPANNGIIVFSLDAKIRSLPITMAIGSNSGRASLIQRPSSTSGEL
ncbi:hypothetical protein OUZ56_006209 [Daphnia magna]|uniref:Uncharacterized protein n=1 Tax=Daphnia magna TaxID=35525 RepID=A0ABQ9YV01_9CRUS|nr:hypothetical protein OUZ56_006209 [Daphnia magna]